MKTAVVIGATGLIGNELLLLLSKSEAYSTKLALVRKMPANKIAGIEYRQIDFAEIEQQNIPNNADMFCALGTTIKVAGSKEAFRKVDYDYVVAFAKLAKNKQASNLVVISAITLSRLRPFKEIRSREGL